MRKLALALSLTAAACLVEPPPLESTEEFELETDIGCPVGARGSCGTGGTPLTCSLADDEEAICCANLTPTLFLCCLARGGTTTCQEIEDPDGVL
jgi:hypothetical protein